MFRRNPGRFNKRITLLKPSNPARDELGGVADITYTPAVGLFAMVTVKDQSRRTVNGDYVTADTRYFVIRDISAKYPINANWRLKYNGYTYIINNVELIDESVPTYLQITATAVNPTGEVL
nr:MAG TPA: Putative head tail adaptor [Bacteriophage sp.]